MLSFWKEKKRILLFLFIFTMILPLVRAQFYDLFPNIGELYMNNFVWFDFFIYLAIFGTLTKSVFEKRFEHAANALAIGIGIAMSMSLVLWEDWQGQSLFMIGKWWVLIVALVFVWFVIYTFIYDRTRKKALAIIIASILVLILLYLIGIASGIGGIPNNLMDYARYGGVILVAALFLYLLSRGHGHGSGGFGGGGGGSRPPAIHQHYHGMKPEEVVNSIKEGVAPLTKILEEQARQLGGLQRDLNQLQEQLKNLRDKPTAPDTQADLSKAREVANDTSNETRRAAEQIQAANVQLRNNATQNNPDSTRYILGKINDYEEAERRRFIESVRRLIIILNQILNRRNQEINNYLTPIISQVYNEVTGTNRMFQLVQGQVSNALGGIEKIKSLSTTELKALPASTQELKSLRPIVDSLTRSVVILSKNLAPLNKLVGQVRAGDLRKVTGSLKYIRDSRNSSNELIRLSIITQRYFRRSFTQSRVITLSEDKKQIINEFSEFINSIQQKLNILLKLENELESSLSGLINLNKLPEDIKNRLAENQRLLQGFAKESIGQWKPTIRRFRNALF